MKLAKLLFDWDLSFITYGLTIIVLDKKTAADLYLNLLVPWEEKYKNIPQKGNFDIRSKEFTAFKRVNELFVVALNTKAEAHKEIEENTNFGTMNKQIIIFQKGDGSRARSLFKHLRNSVAHAHVEKIKIENKWFLLFSAAREKQHILKAQIQQSKLGDLIAALKSTIKD